MRHQKPSSVCRSRIGVYDEKGRLVERSNSGIESQQTDDNKYKAEYSDAMKRCGFLWGIGSELYTSPFIWVSKEKYRTRTVNGKERFADKLTVQDIRIENKRITGLAIINSAGERVYYYVEQKKGTNK